VDVKAEKNKATFSVHSPFGIATTVIERAGEKWLDAVEMRLDLKGLENIKVTDGKGEDRTLGVTSAREASRAVSVEPGE
jgi:hypothetical protein